MSRLPVFLILAIASGLPAVAPQIGSRPAVVSHGSPGPCDLYREAKTPCVAAHSTTRALYASYNGPLYQVKRNSDGKTLEIGVVRPVGSPRPDAGGYANAAAQDAFCVHTTCLINLIYDQTGKGNHLYQAAPGTFKGPAKGAFDTQPIADMAPITIAGHKAYGVFIIPGMGFRNNNAVDIAIGDEPEGIYYVVDGTHYDSGCCFDYGNSSTNGRAVGTGTMETTYFGTSTVWGRGNGAGPWIMSDVEAGLFSGQDAKQNVADPTIDSWRFVTAVVDGGGGNQWDLRGGDAQKGNLTTFYSGVRPSASRSGGYYPMRKQGGILLGTGGDNGNGSSGTFYEGVITSGYPTEATTDAVQANIVAARYDVPRVVLSRLTTFTPGLTQEVTQTFTNTTGVPVTGLKLSLGLPSKQWTATAVGGTQASQAFPSPVAPGASVTGKFMVTSPAATGAGFVTGIAEWKGSTAGGAQVDTATARVRNVLPVKINEVRFSADTTDQFIELYNASDKAVDLSNWTLVNTPSQWASVKLASIPPGTKLVGGAFYVLGLSSSGLVAPANPGARTINVRSTTGFASGQKIDIDGEARMIATVGTSAETATTLFIPVSTGPWITFPVGSTNLPVANARGFAVGEKIGIDLGGNYEVASVTAVGKAATQTTLADATARGTTVIKVAAGSNIAAGDKLTVDTGRFKEAAKVANVDASGTVTMAAPLRFEHRKAVDVSDAGTGVSFSPATRFQHRSGDSVQALGSGISLDRPLVRSHPYGAPVENALASTGYYGPPAPNQWFGAVLSSSAGSVALVDPSGTAVVDAVVYGSQQSNSSANGTIASPELATLEGEQGKGGCIAAVPNIFNGSGTSIGRFPDGADADSNCTDFLTQTASTLAAAASGGMSNIKVAGVAGFSAGQTILIDTGANAESAVVATVGTAGATTVGTPTAKGATVIPVASGAGFTPGQTITIGSGTNAETAVVVAPPRRGVATLTVASPLTLAHDIGSQVSGTGVTLVGALTRDHATGAQVSDNVPTPGASNKYSRKTH